jgi:anhydro-N-acetylmuramic acid kinase
MSFGFMTFKRAIGLMSGTSLDGVDVALIETDGEIIRAFGPHESFPYKENERILLHQALVEGSALADRDARPGCLGEAEQLITRAHAEAAEKFLSHHDIEPSSIDVIGFHGQTILHRPEQSLTVQIGDGKALAERLKCSVVYDFRRDDVAAGGQGAPLVPVFHRALALSRGLELPLAFLNIGGVSNVTFLTGGGEMLAFDTGPGNALIDDFVNERAGLPYDDAGKIAACGQADEALLSWLRTHPFYSRQPPKSLDRNWFSKGIAAHFSLQDGAATLTHFTARSVVHALDFVSEKPRQWIVSGGGVLNAELMRLLRLMLKVPVVSADEMGWSSAAMEAQAFGYLAVRSLAGLPISFPGTTGVDKALRGGVLC